MRFEPRTSSLIISYAIDRAIARCVTEKTVDIFYMQMITLCAPPSMSSETFPITEVADPTVVLRS